MASLKDMIANVMARQMRERPVRPEFESQLDPNTGLLKDPLTIKKFDPVELNTGGLEKMRGIALGEGESPWAKMMLERQGLEQSQRKDMAQSQLAGQTAMARSDLAMRGGLSQGARERLAQNSLRSGFNANQQLSREGELDRLNIGLADQQRRDSFLQQLPGQELAALEPQFRNQSVDAARQQFNIGNAIGEKRAKDVADLSAYAEQMKAWAANKQADATANAGKK